MGRFSNPIMDVLTKSVMAVFANFQNACSTETGDKRKGHTSDTTKKTIKLHLAAIELSLNSH